MRPHVEPALIQLALERGLVKPADVEEARGLCTTDGSSRLAWLVREGRLPLGALAPLYTAAVPRRKNVGTDEADRYVPVASLGAGGAAEVVLYRDEWRDDFLAIKFPGPSMHEDGGFEALLREPRALCRLHHPQIVALVDVRPVDDRLAILMEHVPGGTLRHRMNRPDRARGWPVDDALAILADVLIGLAAAHAHGIVHRDIKPENLLVTEPGGHRVKITDFGIARCTWRATVTCSAAGTVHYMAPEALDGHAREEADLYSVGVLAYELLAGTRPFEGRSFVEITQKILEGDAPPLSEMAPELAPALAAVVMRAIAPVPGQRFSGAAAFREALVAAAVPRPVVQKTRPAPYATTTPLPGPAVPPPASSGGTGTGGGQSVASPCGSTGEGAARVAAPPSRESGDAAPGLPLRQWLARPDSRPLPALLAASGSLVRALDRAWGPPPSHPHGAVDAWSIRIDPLGEAELDPPALSSATLADERREAAALLFELAFRMDARRLAALPPLAAEVPGYPFAADRAIRALFTDGADASWRLVVAALAPFDGDTDWVAHAVASARALSAAGHLDRVAELIRSAIQMHPGTADLHLALAEAYTTHGHPDWAQAPLEAALDGAPCSSDAALALARLCRERGRPARVLELVEPLVGLPAASREARRLKAVALAELGRRAEAIREMEAVVADGGGTALRRMLEKWKREAGPTA